MSKGIELIAAERARQMAVEGWTPAHDAEHVDGELAKAAACYAAGKPIFCEERLYVQGDERIPHISMINLWPWGKEWYKPKGRLRDLTRAGALIAAEIDRLLANAPEEK